MYFINLLFNMAKMEGNPMILLSFMRKKPTFICRPLIVAMLLVSHTLYAREKDNVEMYVPHTESLAPEQYFPPEGKRMGEWLPNQLNQLPQPSYEHALTWQSASEEKVQETQHTVLSRQLQQFTAQPSANAVIPFSQWIQQLPATGRVVLPAQDPRYLQVNPSLDPVFKQGDVVHVYQRPTTVTVLFDNGQACRVVHQADAHAQAYVQRCMENFKRRQTSDEGYLISPDGTVKRIALAQWNAQKQISPAPGAWIWIPEQQHGWSKQLSQDVAEFLATQGIDLPLPYGQDETPLNLTLEQQQIHADATRDLPVSNSDWGVTGLLQTPTARMQKQGHASVHVAHVDPYTQYNLTLQPFDWLETAMRYTNINGVSYGAVSPDQDYKDKSLDVKLRLLNESRWLPALAVGWRDPAGTSLFGGEYLVANKRYGDFDFSLGLGWGYLGARGDIDNPLGLIADRFEERVADRRGQGGEFSPESWFTGKTALFGGVQWHSPYQPLTVKVEYDGNDYKSEPLSQKDYQVDVPVNVGVTWQNKGVQLSAGLERGDKFMFGVALQGDLSQLGQKKPSFASNQNNNSTTASRILPASLGYQIPLSKVQPAQTPQEQVLQHISQASGWKAYKLTEQNGILTVYAEDDGGVFVHERLVKVSEILSRVAPAHTKLMQIELSRYGEPVSRYNITPATWKAQYQQLLPTSQQVKQAFNVTPATAKVNSAPTLAEKALARGYLTFAPSFSQSIGGPDGYLYGVYATANANYKLWQGSWLNATAQARLFDNYDNYTYTADSQLPRVRTNIREYMTTSRVLMPNLQWTQFKQLDKNLFGLAYAGYLDPMFAGLGGEVLYRPTNSSWAIGADINQVRQREFDQHFGLQDYDVTTGHVSLYWDMPWYDVTMKLSAGQYLAGDRGATLDLSRTFKNGVKMGAWATKTNVSAEQFGEGSMDKGIYVSIPFDALFGAWSSGSTTLVYQPLIRDGGAKLNRVYNLYDLTSPSTKQSLMIENPKGY